ncbi:nicotinate (nicotinamide) nucleotide adenylyltransferase [Lyngbya aestuarii BL J]|uniref:Probable nicotinate-nucleotide adenylyltransferase n=1 Tax=Lyngbya aestuarii BL J TaxID=1348334 RepID=U7QP20_9CYAN|nr:nicotinate-nucleotide adenylyltransferase [Lyngbya aestuarii]ERT09007.1 nicotinate (nicotinamide) nucleotide adenylyltransferase [Lyngbya aestuarii BL J]
MQIALFGTSADPPTAGHQKILSWLSQHFDQVVVWASDNPFKSHQTAIEHRTTMLKILIEDISPDDNIALHQELSSRRTLETVQGVQQYWPDAELHLVVGSDLIAQMPSWYKIEALLSQVNLLVIPRPGYQVEDEKIKTLQQIGGNVAIASITGLPVSSSNYRENGDPETLTPAIQVYIEQNSLYQSSQ